MHKVAFGAIPWESPMRGIRQKKVVIEQIVLRLVEYSREMPFHWCEKGHIGYVIQGGWKSGFRMRNGPVPRETACTYRMGMSTGMREK
jgi:hypothetical protein